MSSDCFVKIILVGKTKVSTASNSTTKTINQAATPPPEEDTKPLNIQKLEISLDPEKEEERWKRRREEIKEFDEKFGSIDMKKSYPKLFELLWYGQLPCTDVRGITSRQRDEMSFIKKCYWKNKPINCNSIFQKRPTDQGMCCSFNMEKAENILKKTKYTEAIAAQQAEEAKLGFESDEKPGWYIQQNEPVSEAGRDNGLKLIFDGHSDRLTSSTVVDDFLGFVTVIDANNKFPTVSRSSLISRPGLESSINVRATHQVGLEEIRKYDPLKRNCYFPDEFELNVHKLYSQSNCIFECKTKFAFQCLETCDENGKHCNCHNVSIVNTEALNESGSKNCVPWFYPSADENAEKMCNPWHTKTFRNILKEHIPKDACNYCLPDCSTTLYDSTMTYAELRKCDRTNMGSSMLCDLENQELNPAPWIKIAQEEYKNANEDIPWYLKTSKPPKDKSLNKFSDTRTKIADPSLKSTVLFPSELEETPSYDAFERDIGIVNIYFGSDHTIKYVKKNKMSNYDFLSQIGGSIGLAMGISIISVVEIVYWFTIRFFRNIRS